MLRFSSSFALAIKSVVSTSRPCEVDECGQTRARSTQLCAVSLRYFTNCAITITSKWLQAVVRELRKATIAQAIVSSAAGGILRPRSNGFDGLCQIFAFKCQRNARASPRASCKATAPDRHREHGARFGEEFVQSRFIKPAGVMKTRKLAITMVAARK